MNFRNIVLSSAAFFALGTSAHAADIAPAASSWTGFYLGAGGGASSTSSDTDAGGYASFEFDTEGDYNGGPININDSNGDTFGSYDIDCDVDDGDDECDVAVDSAATIGDGKLPADVVETIAEDFLDGLFEDGDNDSGLTTASGTVELGADYQLGEMLVVGLSGSFNLGETQIKNSAHGGGDTDYEIERRFADADGDQVSKLETDLTLGNSWTIGGRLGAIVGGSNLLFVSGGYISAQAELKASYDMFSSGSADENGDDVFADVGLGASSSSDEWLNGYYLGTGFESMLGEHLSLKMEYRFADLGSIETSSERIGVDNDINAEVIAIAGVSAEADPLVHSVRATLNWRF